MRAPEPGGRRSPRTTATARTTTAATKRAVAAQKRYAKPTGVTEAGAGWYAAAKAGQAAVSALAKRAPAQAARGAGKAVTKGAVKPKGPTQAQVRAARQGRVEDAALRADLHDAIKKSAIRDVNRSVKELMAKGGSRDGTKPLVSRRSTPPEKVRGTSGHQPRTTKGMKPGKANVVKVVGKKKKPNSDFLQQTVDQIAKKNPTAAKTLRKQYNIPATRTTSVGAGRLTKGQKAAGSRYTAQARKGK
jgi:hypothetical protein